MIETMCEILNTKHYGAAVMADLEGAFDATRRKGLIYKLYKTGLEGMLLAILDSFLTNRFSRNLVNGYVSEWFESNYGLPQGSILSPVLFLVFTGDLSADPAKFNLQLPNCPSKHPPNESKYADDYNLWRSSDNIKQLEEGPQWDLNIIMQWCQK